MLMVGQPANTRQMVQVLQQASSAACRPGVRSIALQVMLAAQKTPVSLQRYHACAASMYLPWAVATSHVHASRAHTTQDAQSAGTDAWVWHLTARVPDVQAVRAAVTAGLAEEPAEDAGLAWPAACLGACVPPAAAHTRDQLQGGHANRLPDAEVQVRARLCTRCAVPSTYQMACPVRLRHAALQSCAPMVSTARQELSSIVACWLLLLRLLLLLILLTPSQQGIMRPTHVAQVILELFKLLLVALSAAPRLAAGTEERLMGLLVPLLVAALAPADEQPHEAVASLALQMIQRLAAGPSAGA